MAGCEVEESLSEEACLGSCFFALFFSFFWGEEDDCAGWVGSAACGGFTGACTGSVDVVELPEEGEAGCL